MSLHPKLTTTLSKYQKIILVGGGTGGHIQPVVSLTQYLKTWKLENLKPPELLWIGGKNSQEEQAANGNGIEFTAIPTFKLSTTKSPKIFLYPFVLFEWIREARKILRSIISNEVRQSSNKKSGSLSVGKLGTGSNSRWQKLENLKTWKLENWICIFSKGGPWSVAVGIAAWTLGIPLYIHESDTIPGRSSRLLGRIVTKVFLWFESAKKYFNPEKCEVVWQILNPVFEKWRMKNEEWRIRWETKKKHILVICGSQWSKAIFEEILRNLEEILKENELILVLGKLNTDIRKRFEELYEPLDVQDGDFSASPFGTPLEMTKPANQPTSQPALQLLDWISQEDLASLIPDTDIAITRGSATTLAELTAFQNLKTWKLENLKPKLIIIPLPYSADNHQYWNAREYEKMWHILLEQKNLNKLTQTIESLWQNLPRSST